MPVKSYLVFPHQGKKKELQSVLHALPGCETILAENRDILVLITDTENQEREEQLLAHLAGIDSLDHFSLVSGYSDSNAEIKTD